jgi:hypothetical protein
MVNLITRQIRGHSQAGFSARIVPWQFFPEEPEERGRELALAAGNEIQLWKPLAEYEPQARAFLLAAKAASTLRAYWADWNHFEAWCGEHGQLALSAVPETVAYYLTALAGTHKPATLQRRLTAISKAHQAAGHPSPASTQHAAVSEILKGIKRTVGTAQPGKEPLFTVEIRKMIAALPGNLQGARDRALLVIGFAGGFRRSELAALNTDDVAETDDGLVLSLRRSKTDQEGQGSKVALPWGSHPRPARSVPSAPGSWPPGSRKAPCSAASTTAASSRARCQFSLISRNV